MLTNEPKILTALPNGVKTVNVIKKGVATPVREKVNEVINDDLILLFPKDVVISYNGIVINNDEELRDALREHLKIRILDRFNLMKIGSSGRREKADVRFLIGNEEYAPKINFPKAGNETLSEYYEKYKTDFHYSYKLAITTMIKPDDIKNIK